MRRLDWLDYIALFLLIIGGLNWGSIALFDVNLVARNLGHWAWAPRLIYALTGAAGFFMLFEVWRFRKR